MKLSALAIKRPIAILMAVCIVLVLGAFSFINLPVDLLPEMKFPMMAVFITYDGAAPGEVENMITRPLEEALATVPGVEKISSTSSQNSSVVMLEFSWGSDMDFRALDVREQIDMIKGFLPDGAGSPTVFQFDPSMMPIMSMAVMGDLSPEELKLVAEDVVKPRLERVEGVASVNVYGGVEREIQVEVDPSRLAAHGISIDQLTQLLSVGNMNISAGRLTEGSNELRVRSIGEYRSLEDLENLVIMNNQAGTLYLRDVAEVKDGFKEQSQIMRLDGSPGISVVVFKQSDANTVTVSKSVHRALQSLNRNLPQDSGVTVLFDSAEFINDSISNVLQIGLIGAVLALFILFLFLRNLRSTLIIGLAIPVSIISTFVLMYFNGVTLNMISLAGLALGIGMMVDNAIVILENIFRHRNQGLDAMEAAHTGSEEVANAIMAATLTTIVVFLPVVFVKGIASQLFSAMAWTVSFSLFASLIVALTIVPVLSSKLLKIPKNGNGNGKLSARFARFFEKVDEFYGRMLHWALGHRKLTVMIMVVAFVASLALVPFVGTEFIPGMDDDWLTASISLPDGSSMEDTSELVAEVERRLSEFKEVSYMSVVIGETGGMNIGAGGNSNRASMEIRLIARNQRSLDNNQVADEMRTVLRTIPGAEITIQRSQMMSMGGSGPPVSIMIKGDSLDTLRELSDDVRDLVEEVEGTREVTTSFDRGWPELLVTVDRDKAAAYGIQPINVATTLRTALSGQVVTRYRTGGQELDVRLQIPEAIRNSLSDLKNIEMMTPSGVRVPLGELAEFRQDVGPMSISRNDQVRSATVTAQLAGRPLGPVVADINKGLNEMTLPAGYTVQFGGEQEQMAESFGSLGQALVLAILLVYMIMAAQFESLLHPFIIMFALPQTFVGVVLSLVLTGRTLNVPAFIGLIMLAGIVVNNAIVLIDYINILRERGRSCREAILEAGPVRLRPILMTTLTTVLGMFPLALGVGSGSETYAPLGTVVIGGLLASTMLTLLVVPVIYSIMEDLGVKVQRRKRKKLVGEVSL
jgi:HAE1 family hydrophobic/amphiphilic exporter-1